MVACVCVCVRPKARGRNKPAHVAGNWLQTPKRQTGRLEIRRTHAAARCVTALSQAGIQEWTGDDVQAQASRLEAHDFQVGIG